MDVFFIVSLIDLEFELSVHEVLGYIVSRVEIFVVTDVDDISGVIGICDGKVVLFDELDILGTLANLRLYCRFQGIKGFRGVPYSLCDVFASDLDGQLGAGHDRSVFVECGLGIHINQIIFTLKIIIKFDKLTYEP